MILSKTHRVIRSNVVPFARGASILHPSFRRVQAYRRNLSSFDGKNESRSIEFSTLHHELHSVARTAFAKNDLFGTYNPKIQDFEYMSYGDFGNEVDRFLAMLRNLGELVDFPRKPSMSKL